MYYNGTVKYIIISRIFYFKLVKDIHFLNVLFEETIVKNSKFIYIV